MTRDRVVSALVTEPLPVRTERAIYGLIGKMDLSSDNKLPREEILARQLGVSRTTVRQALDSLASKGVVFRRQGKGTFVNPRSVGIRTVLSPCMEMMSAIRNSGYRPDVEILSTVQLSRENFAEYGDGVMSLGDVREGLALSADDPLVCSDKVFLADGRPCILCRDFFGAATIGGLGSLDRLEHYEDSIYRFLYATSSRRVEWDKVEVGVVSSEELRAIFPSESIAERFEVPAVLALRSFNYDQDDLPLIYTTEFFDTSVIKFNLIRQKKIDYTCLTRDGDTSS